MNGKDGRGEGIPLLGRLARLAPVVLLLVGGCGEDHYFPPAGLGEDGQPRPEFVAAAQAYRRALARGDRDALLRMANPSAPTDGIDQLVRWYGHHRNSIISYEPSVGPVPGAGNLTLVVECSPTRKVRNYMPFSYQPDGRWAPNLWKRPATKRHC